MKEKFFKQQDEKLLYAQYKQDRPKFHTLQTEPTDQLRLL